MRKAQVFRTNCVHKTRYICLARGYSYRTGAARPTPVAKNDERKESMCTEPVACA
jgi:hypothetical protein